MRKSINISRAILSIASLLAIGCVSDSVTTAPSMMPVADAKHTSATPREGPDQKALDSLARGLALYLANAEARKQLRDDLRDAPARHAIHLTTYLRGARGRALGRGIELYSGLSSARVIDIVSERSGYQISMPGRLSRVTWTGGPELVVKGVANELPVRLQSQNRERGFDTKGSEQWSDPSKASLLPLLVIQPVDRDFGLDPERARSTAPRADRSTVSTREAEMMTMSDPCDLTMVDHCTYGPDTTAGIRQRSVLVPSGYSWASCFGGVDNDSDGLADQCEYELAHTFRPLLAVGNEVESCLAREPYWAAKNSNDPLTPETISVFYAVAYSRDCGSPNPYCPMSCASHLGDSEFIILDLRYRGGGRWEVSLATLSAHFGSEVDETVVMRGEDLEYSPAYPGRPVSWVALFKHANYGSRSRCDRGVYYFDTCDNNTVSASTVDVLPGANLGRRFNQLIIGPTPSRIGNPGSETLWATTGRFWGWLTPDGGEGSTPYGLHLDFFSF